MFLKTQQEIQRKNLLFARGFYFVNEYITLSIVLICQISTVAAVSQAFGR